MDKKDRSVPHHKNDSLDLSLLTPPKEPREEQDFVKEMSDMFGHFFDDIEDPVAWVAQERRSTAIYQVNPVQCSRKKEK